MTDLEIEELMRKTATLLSFGVQSVTCLLYIPPPPPSCPPKSVLPPPELPFLTYTGEERRQTVEVYEERYGTNAMVRRAMGG